MRKLFLGVPAGACQITAPTALSIARAKDEAVAQGYSLHFECHGGDADVARARNVLLGKFLASDATHFFGLDADVSFFDGAVPRLIDHGVDFVCGVYRFRTDDFVGYPVQWTEPRRLLRSRIDGPLLTAALVPAGFILLTRQAITTMALAPGERWVEAGEDPVVPELRYPFLFDWFWEGRKRRSEDYNFCRKWRALGGEIYVDPTIPLDHTGPKVFRGNLLEHLALEAKAATPAPAPAPPPLIERARQYLSAPPG